MQTPWKSHAVTAASLPLHPSYREERLQQQVRTYLLYRSFSTDDRNRRGLEWWREAQRRHAEARP
jgi:hypothetical protein